MTFTPRFLDEVRERISLAQVIGRRVKLTRRGRNLFGLCPFHREKSPSFSVRDDEGFFHCFGCGASGDVFKYIMHTEGLSFPEAVERLADEAGVPMPVVEPGEAAAAVARKSIHEANEAACLFFERCLREPSARQALDYLKGRGFDEATITRFRLGYAPPARAALKGALISQFFDEELLVSAGLLARPEGGGGTRERFFDRIMFPIFDRRGRVIAFGGRALGDRQPKYLNSPETPIFHKGLVLYGHPDARRAAREKGEILVVEGYTDVIALDRGGFAHVMAPLGTALTERQIEELWRYVKEPTLCFDGDAAGERAAFRAAERSLPLLRAGLSLKFALLPEGEDPDSLMGKRGAGAMREVLETAKPLADLIWRMETAGQAVDTPERRALVEKNLLARVSAISDPQVRKHYESHVKSRLWKMFQDRRRPGRSGSGAAQAAVSAGIRRTSLDSEHLGLQRERAIVATILHHPQMLAGVAEEFAGAEITNPELDRLRRAILETAVCLPDLDFEGLKGHLQRQGFEKIVNHLAGSDTKILARSALPEAADRDAEIQWRHMLARHRQVNLKAELQVAEEALVQDSTQENMDRLVALQDLLAGGEGDEADLDGYGISADRVVGE
jgi:DNA primase